MTADRVVVTAAGFLAAAWVLWYFLVPPKPAALPPRRDIDP